MMCELYLNKAVKTTTIKKEKKPWSFNTSHTAFYESQMKASKLLVSCKYKQSCSVVVCVVLVWMVSSLPNETKLNGKFR